MTYANTQQLNQIKSVFWLKSFSTWFFALLICSLVVGFPLLILVVTIGALSAVVLQAVLPMSAVLVVAAAITGLHVLGLAMVSLFLTFRGIHPNQVSWLTWLSGVDNVRNQPIYASCPLTCEMR
jgi:hypothetical protein